MSYISKKGKNIHNQTDILSALPSDLLYRILDRVPLRDAARMSILSHKWKDLWTSIPSLVFDDHICPNCSLVNGRDQWSSIFCNIVSLVLLQHKGTLSKFSLLLPLMGKNHWSVTPWMSYISGKGIKDFSLFNYRNEAIELSSHIYFYHDLEKLKLQGCKFSRPANFKGFPKLTMLELANVVLDYSQLSDIIANCPVLQNLSLTSIAGMSERNIIIDAPNLNRLVIQCQIDSLDINNGENLVSASIIAWKRVAIKSVLPRLNHFLNVVSNSSKLEILGLGGVFCKAVFTGGHHPNTYPKIRNLELLSLYLEDADDLCSTISCIQSFPNVQRLALSVGDNHNQYEDEHVVELDYNRILHHLRFVAVKIVNGSSAELKLIEFLLGCSPMLEKLHVAFTKLISHLHYSKKLAKVNQFRRASQKVEVICIEPPNSSGCCSQGYRSKRIKF